MKRDSMESSLPTSSPPRGHWFLRAGALLAFAAVIWRIWWRPVHSSLWLDECVTYWMVKDGWSEMLHRSAEFSGGNPFYYIIVQKFVDLLGPSELSLRLPSLLAMLGAAGFVFRIARRWMDVDTALYAIVFFAGNNIVQFEARNARTYALGLFFFASSTFFLIRLLEEGRKRDALLYGVLASCVFHTHFVLALSYLIHAGIAVESLVRHRRLPWAKLGLAGLALAAALAPSVPYFLALNARKSSLVVAPDPFVEEWVKVSLPMVTTFGSVLILLVWAVLSRRRDPSAPAPDRLRMALLATWAVLPPLLIFSISKLTPTKLLIPRYFCYFIPGYAILVAIGLRQLSRPAFRLGALALYVSLAIAAYSQGRHHVNDWKSAAVAVRATTKEVGPLKLLIHSGLIEAKSSEWWGDPEKSAYLNSVFSLYPVPEGTEVLALPQAFSNDEADDRMVQLVDESIAAGRTFMVVSRDYDPGIITYIAGYARKSGWTQTMVGKRHGNLIAARYDPPR